jgi:hypothetical protein
MRYFKDNGVYAESEVKRLVYPSSLPRDFKPEHVESKGFLPVTETEKPVCTDLQVVQNDGVKLINNVATQIWSVVAKFESQEEVDTYLAGIKEKEDLEISNQAKERLRELDIKSIRSIREYLSSKEDAPQYLKDFEIKATDERIKIISDTN